MRTPYPGSVVTLSEAEWWVGRWSVAILGPLNGHSVPVFGRVLYVRKHGGTVVATIKTGTHTTPVDADALLVPLTLAPADPKPNPLVSDGLAGRLNLAPPT